MERARKGNVNRAGNLEWLEDREESGDRVGTLLVRKNLLDRRWEECKAVGENRMLDRR